eukprot:TRINITY_DN102492_c0_g1_i1.p1 TRINITY_DN102492_c0_g1~~TRINITY_DN102492_c0_g1_i1.p1  ORF type:complete len:213 (+),score=41.93 TRINITY_DN102492_c0_g1_i1:85-639(+)
MTEDMISPCLKNAKHFASFRPPFLVSLDDIIEALELGQDIVQKFNIRNAEEDMKKRNLLCHKCGADFARKFAELKRHLSVCSARPPPMAAPSRWQRIPETASIQTMQQKERQRQVALPVPRDFDNSLQKEKHQQAVPKGIDCYFSKKRSREKEDCDVGGTEGGGGGSAVSACSGTSGADIVDLT